MNFPHDFGILLPILGMGIGALAIWTDYSRQRKALDVLRVYAEKDQEPPAGVLAVLNRASEADAPKSSPWARFAFYLILAVGFALTAAWFNLGTTRDVWVFVAGFGITSFFMVAYAASHLITALRSPRADG